MMFGIGSGQSVNPKSDRVVRYRELDGLRGLAALSVFWSHSIGMLSPSPTLLRVQNSGIRTLWDGAAAVDLFFVLSAFVLTIPFVGPRRRPLDYWRFAAKRAFRIYPACWAALALAVALAKPAHVTGLSDWFNSLWIQQATAVDVAQHIMLIGPLRSDVLNPVIWSLRTEMHMSLFLPCWIVLIRDASLRANLVYLVAAGGAGAAVPALRYLPLFAAGAILAHYYHNLPKLGLGARKAICSLALFLGIILYGNRFIVGCGPAHALSAAGAAVIVAIVPTHPPVRRLLQSRVLSVLGDISYSFYLFHLPILIVISRLVFSRTQSAPLAWACALVIAFVCACASHRLIELPFQRLGTWICSGLHTGA